MSSPIRLLFVFVSLLSTLSAEPPNMILGTQAIGGISIGRESISRSSSSAQATIRRMPSSAPPRWNISGDDYGRPVFSY